jgi:hypothetical protein
MRRIFQATHAVQLHAHHHPHQLHQFTCTVHSVSVEYTRQTTHHHHHHPHHQEPVHQFHPLALIVPLFVIVLTCNNTTHHPPPHHPHRCENHQFVTHHPPPAQPFSNIFRELSTTDILCINVFSVLSGVYIIDALHKVAVFAVATHHTPPLPPFHQLPHHIVVIAVHGVELPLPHALLHHTVPTDNHAHHAHQTGHTQFAQLLPFLSIVPLLTTLFAKILKLQVFNVTQEFTVNTL